MIKIVLFDYGGVLLSKWLIPQIRLRLFAHKLRANGIKTGILSNIDFLRASILRITLGYIGFSPIILSYQEKINKPDIKLYNLAVKHLKAAPNEIIFIDNREENLLPAKQLGMKVIKAQKSSQIISDIKTIIQRENKLSL